MLNENDKQSTGVAESTKHDTVSRLRQTLHAATGDRDAEAKALDERSPEEVSANDARLAVARANGEAPQSPDATIDADHDQATPRDAIAVHRDHGE